MRAWKVFHLTCNENEFESATIEGRVTSYTRGETWRRPAGDGPAACLRTRKQAEKFLKILRGVEIRQKNYWVVLPVEITKSEENELWISKANIEGVSTRVCSTHLDYLPLGTILADTVRILEVDHDK